MEKRKLDNYRLTASVHTTEIHSRYIPVRHGIDKRLLKVHYTTDDSTGEHISHCIVNPHYYGAGEILSYTQYEDVMAALTEDVGLHDYEYDRIDIRLDSTEDNYLEYFKLNSLLIGLFTIPLDYPSLTNLFWHFPLSIKENLKTIT